MTPPTLAVIGTAGRQSDGPRITPELYDAMHGQLLEVLDDWGFARSGRLVSGGAAVADHLAVRVYLAGDAGRLLLCLPARFEGGRFIDNPRDPMRTAQVANRYHAQFSQACGLDSLGELATAIARGAEVRVIPGFKSRNLEVAAAATHLLALTFGLDQAPVDLGPEDLGFGDFRLAGLKDGGTAHTWGEAWRLERKRHVSLSWLERQLPAWPVPGRS
jgi:hypothetical protein